MATAADTVARLVAPILDDLGLELYDLEVGGGSVRLVIDKPGGVDLQEITEVTRMVSRELDHADPIAAAYTLEVSSPGLERTLRTPAHFARAIGSTVALKTRPGTDGERRVQGVLVSCDDEVVVVRPDDDAGTERSIAIADLERARTVFVWGPAPKPGKRPSATPRKKAAVAAHDPTQEPGA